MSERKKSAHWTTAGDIAAAAEKLWSGGRLPSALISGEELFPYSIKLSCPKTSEMAENIAEVRAWRAALDARSANERRRSYRLEYRSVRHSVLGKNSIPCRAVIETAEDALSLAGRKKDSEILQRLTEETADRLPALGGLGKIYMRLRVDALAYPSGRLYKRDGRARSAYEICRDSQENPRRTS